MQWGVAKPVLEASSALQASGQPQCPEGTGPCLENSWLQQPEQATASPGWVFRAVPHLAGQPLARVWNPSTTRHFLLLTQESAFSRKPAKPRMWLGLWPCCWKPQKPW